MASEEFFQILRGCDGEAEERRRSLTRNPARHLPIPEIDRGGARPIERGLG